MFLTLKTKSPENKRPEISASIRAIPLIFKIPPVAISLFPNKPLSRSLLVCALITTGRFIFKAATDFCLEIKKGLLGLLLYLGDSAAAF